MTEQKIVEIFEDRNFSVKVNQNTITAKKSGFYRIKAIESGDSITGWIFKIGKDEYHDPFTAINCSKLIGGK